MAPVIAPELIVEQWFNADRPISLAELRGRPVLLHVFQMLCPGCVAHALPQVQRAAAMLKETDLCVIGLHSVFEHHSAMTPVSLAAFLHEYRITFPVGVDRPATDGAVPQTMAAYGFRGTPSLVLIDREGFIRHHGFGQEEDMALGFRLAMLLAERIPGVVQKTEHDEAGCSDQACPTPTVRTD